MSAIGTRKVLITGGGTGIGRAVAKAVVYLLGASWTTGAELVVDGGILLRE